MMPNCFIANCIVLTAVTKLTISAWELNPQSVLVAAPAELRETVVAVLTSFVLAVIGLAMGVDP